MENKKLDYFMYGAFSEGKLYYFSKDKRLLKSWNVFDKGTIAVETALDKESHFDRIISVNGTIYSIDASGRWLYSFSPADHRASKICLPFESTLFNNFVDFFSCESSIYIIPYYQAALWEYDVYNREIKRHTYPMKGNYGRIHNSYVGVKKNDEYWLFPYKGSCVLRFCLADGTFNEYDSPDGYRYVNATVYDDKIYTISVEGDIFVWDHQSGNYNLELKVDIGYRPSNIVVTSSEYIILPHDVNNPICAVNKTSKNISELHDYPDGFFYDENCPSAFAGHIELDDRVMFMPHSTSHMMIISKKDSKISWIDTPIQNDNLYDRLMNDILTSRMHQESDGELVYWLQALDATNFFEDITSLIQYRFD